MGMKTQVISPEELLTMTQNELGDPFDGSKNSDGDNKKADKMNPKPSMSYANWGENAGGKTQEEQEPGPRSKG
jgi:hypothetical protein